MKLNKIIISYIIGFISAISLTVIAGLIYTASDIEFTPKDAGWNVDTVEGAINDIQENYAPKKDLVKHHGNMHIQEQRVNLKHL